MSKDKTSQLSRRKFLGGVGKAENNVSLGRFRAVIQEVTMGTFLNTKKVFLPLMCNHMDTVLRVEKV